MSFLSSTKSSCSSYSSFVSSSSSTSKLDVEQSSSSDKIFCVLPKLNPLVWEIEQSSFPRLAYLASSFWELDCPSWLWSKSVDDDEIFSGALDDYFLLLPEPYICSITFQRRLVLSSQPYSISISSFISTLKALDKTLDAWALRYRHFFCPYVWGQSSKV
jgi:hypothetical protein